MTRLAPIAIVALATASSLTAGTKETQIDVQAGSVADAAIAIARQTGTSIVVADPAAARRPAPRIRGRMSAREAVQRLADAAGLKVVRVSSSAWRLEPKPQSAKRSLARAAPKRVAAPTAVEPAPAGGSDTPIIVIASKRDTPLGELPAQATLIDGERLQLGGVGGTEKIIQRSASVSSTYLGSGRNKLFIRGIADSSFSGPTQATVGQYFGDLRLSYNAPDPDLRLSDMERVEILEGPQGTLYGAGSLGGIIRLVPRSPEAGETSLTGMGGASVTSDGKPGADVHGTINLPLVGDTATLRASVDATTLGGYIDKPVIGQEDVNRTRILAGKAALRIELDPDWTADVVVLGQETEAEDSQYADRDGGRLISSARVTEGSRAQYGQAQLVLTGRLGPVRFKSSTGISSQDLSERYDATGPGMSPRLFVQRNETRMVANETRLWQPDTDGFGWVIGTSLVDNRNTLTRSFGPVGAELASTGVRNTVFEITGYGEASYRIIPAVSLAAGLRVTNVEIGGAGEDVSRQLALAGAAITASRRETAFLPSASVLVDVAPQSQAYLRYQEGFRPGGLAVSGDFVRQFRSDRTRTIELGGRWGLPGRSDFDLAASVSYTRWNDIQADFIDDNGLPSTANIGNGSIFAASVSGGVWIMPDLRAELGATVNDSDVDLPVAASFDRLSRIPNIARFSGRAGLQYQREFGNGLQFTADGWVSYIGKSRLGIGPELGELQGDYFDSGVILRLGRENAGLTLSMTNLANSEGNRFALGTPFSTGRAQETPLQPRTIRIGFDSRF
jgi:outer membrane receptor protein involved in Fe transport